ncbi:YEATS domain-containing protein 2 [Dufourea novaeangliae]|uniref:YEATS domain-containing protein 2 n=1 Tax=Dufourea novaeangliae TaxID=178035 RepID=A0A154P2X3_DUFNO|nr:YEATS domain-containing protein 2 [Dufourea novaeangliae]
MSVLKDQDPDYGPSVANDENHQRIYEENARSNTAKKITAIIEKEFSQEINAKEKEVLEIQERLHRASKALHFLRYVIVADFYNRKQCHNSQNGEGRQTQIHPAIKQLIGKSPKIYDTSLVATSAECPLNTVDGLALKSKESEKEVSEDCPLKKRNNETDEESRPKKIPRYIPPKCGVPESPYPSRGIRHKVRKRIIIGNISKWIPPEWREDAASHKWTMYVRGNKDNPDIDDFVSKVRFFLHPSYRPNDVVEVTTPPFCLSRRGWGEFPLRVQLHFKSALNKPMDIIHHLKLDRTYTGLQTLGSETLVDIWIYTDPRSTKRNTDRGSVQTFDEIGSRVETHFDDSCKIKVESVGHSDSALDFTNNCENASGTASKNSAVLIKQESSQETDDECLTSSERQRFYVDLDHDYCGSIYLNRFEGNLTIDHLSVSPKLVDSSVDEVPKEYLENSNEKQTEPIMNTDSNRIQKKEETSLNDSPLLSEFDTCKIKALPSSCSKLRSNLCPLEISIPPLFESSSKHVLVLQNNETISVDITIPRSDDQAYKHNTSLSQQKVNSAPSRGISLLKKPPGSGPNRAETQQKLKLQLSKNVLLNVNSNIPALKIVERRNPQNDHPANPQKRFGPEEHALTWSNQEELKELKLQPRQKITLGKDKHKLQSKKEFCDQVFRAIDAAKIGDIESLLRFIVRRMPIITRDASDSDYRQLHPYACISEKEFFEYNVAKRTACEWSRAKIIQNLLKKKLFPMEELWTVKEIMIWARLHGYTPCSSDFVGQTMKQKNLPDSTIMKSTSTCTEPDAFCKWLQVCPGRSYDHRLSDAKVAVLEMEMKSISFYDFVCETAREIGIKLNPEEILPSVVDGAAGRMIMKAVECLVDDLVRMSLAKAWERYDNGHPKVIILDDVRGALLNREEFDIFTNQGLGSKYRLASTD